MTSLKNTARQLELLVSKRDRIVQFFRRTGHPHYKNGRELIAQITVMTDPDGSIVIGVCNSPGDEVEIEFLDDDGDEQL